MTRRSLLTIMQSLADGLRLDTDAGRITIRVESHTHELRLESVAVESLRQGVGTLLAETAEGLRNAVRHVGSSPTAALS